MHDVPLPCSRSLPFQKRESATSPLHSLHAAEPLAVAETKIDVSLAGIEPPSWRNLRKGRWDCTITAPFLHPG